MSYQVLARKWRPLLFREIVGQTHVLKALINAFNSKRLHHAYLFTGTRGVGKTTIARIIAKCFNCETDITSTPCGTCSVCREIDEGRFIDLIEIDAASRTKIEDIRELLDNVQYAPSRGRFKVYLIDEVHMLSGHSFNALLKTLEEPPLHVKFILATTDQQKLPATILSRCLQFSLKNITTEHIVKHLSYVLNIENVPFEDDALWLLSRAADGSMRDAMSLTDQAIAFGEGKIMAADVYSMLGTLDHTQVFRILHELIKCDAKALLEAVCHLSEHGPDWNSVLSEILNVLHYVAIAQILPDGIDNSYSVSNRKRILALAHTLSAEDIQFYYQIGLIGRRDLPLAPDPRGGFEMVLLRMLACRSDNSADILQQTPKPVRTDQAISSLAKPATGTVLINPLVSTALKSESESEPVIAGLLAECSLSINHESKFVPVVNLLCNSLVEVEVKSKLQHTVDHVLEVASKQSWLTPIYSLTQVQDYPKLVEQVYALVPKSTALQVVKSVPRIDLGNQLPLDEARIELNIDSAYSYLDDLTSNNITELAYEHKVVDAASLALQWLDLFPKLPISGITSNIAANCQLIAIDGDRWLFHLDYTHSAILNATQQHYLNTALNWYYGRTLTIVIKLIKPKQVIPAQTVISQSLNRQRKAEDVIHSDPLIQQLIQQFGAVLCHIELIESPVP
ncbi:DNA polymerase III subunit gamma/tau [Candidatus Pseudomonas adelgestsugas]|uniref:DNA polymerase III subunit gamma/tau n=1 Tax=Candidatus Pseudomonas adelgestsugas TaxID=1302376 RepID=A0ABX5R941_9PSED|nr:DNA polymerase III subunit gamma/tau [Candidatus Pseudomonas adelgestsugas]QAX82166.1 DNA polymerase III subunit tau [Candidatus Pseudomonas adelgestsugas]